MEVKIYIWEEYPRRYPHFFYQKLRESKEVNLSVMYYGTSNINRKLQDVEVMLKGDYLVEAKMESLTKIKDWDKCIHIVSGVRSTFLKKIIYKLIQNKVDWINWTETVRVDYKWPLKYLEWSLYGYLINRYAIGSFAVGNMSIRQQEALGVTKSKIFLLPYSYPGLAPSGNLDEKIHSFAKGRRIFMFLGELSKRKASDILINAFSNIKGEDWALVMIGRDTKEINVNSLIKTNELNDRVLIYGEINYKNIKNCLNLCDVFILPSVFDGWGAVLNEAASLGKPLISTNMCGASEHLIRNNVNGFIVNSKSVKSLMIAMQKYTNNENLIDLHGAQSMEILKEYTVNENVKRFNSAISKMLYDR
jgi:glycosyltransferase involved in cell wall biosynthesis